MSPWIGAPDGTINISGLLSALVALPELNISFRKMKITRGVLDMQTLLLESFAHECFWLFRHLLNSFAWALEDTIPESLIDEAVLGSPAVVSRKRKDRDLMNELAGMRHRKHARGAKEEEKVETASANYQLALVGETTMTLARRRSLIEYVGSINSLFSLEGSGDVSLASDAGRVGGMKCLFAAMMDMRSGLAFWAPPQALG